MEIQKTKRIRISRSHGESTAVKDVNTSDEMKIIRFELIKYKANDIFSADECALYYRMPPRQL